MSGQDSTLFLVHGLFCRKERGGVPVVSNAQENEVKSALPEMGVEMLRLDAGRFSR